MGLSTVSLVSLSCYHVDLGIDLVQLQDGPMRRDEVWLANWFSMVTHAVFGSSLGTATSKGHVVCTRGPLPSMLLKTKCRDQGNGSPDCWFAPSSLRDDGGCWRYQTSVIHSWEHRGRLRRSIETCSNVFEWIGAPRVCIH